MPAPRATWLRLDPAANIPVAYVENALYENPKVASVAVIGIPDPRLQERACACVVLRLGVEDFTFAEMQQLMFSSISEASPRLSVDRSSPAGGRPPPECR